MHKLLVWWVGCISFSNQRVDNFEMKINLMLTVSCSPDSIIAMMSPEDSWVAKWQRIGNIYILHYYSVLRQFILLMKFTDLLFFFHRKFQGRCLCCNRNWKITSRLVMDYFFKTCVCESECVSTPVSTRGQARAKILTCCCEYCAYDNQINI